MTKRHHESTPSAPVQRTMSDDQRDWCFLPIYKARHGLVPAVPAGSASAGGFAGARRNRGRTKRWRRGGGSHHHVPVRSADQHPHHAGDRYGEQAAQQPSQLKAGQQREHRPQRVQSDGVAADARHQNVVFDLLDARKNRITQITVGNGRNSATMTAGTTDRMGPNIGTSSNRPASTPSTMAYGRPSSAIPMPARTPIISGQGELAAQIAAQHARDVVLQKQRLGRNRFRAT